VGTLYRACAPGCPGRDQALPGLLIAIALAAVARAVAQRFAQGAPPRKVP
jgi:hypothetical protein